MCARAPGAACAACTGRGSSFAGGPIGVAAHTAPARHRGAGRYRRGVVPCGPLRVLGHCPAGRSDEGVFPRPGGSADGGALAICADRDAEGPCAGSREHHMFRRCELLRFCAVCAPCRRLQVFYSCLCAIGWSEAGFLSLCAASRFGLLLVAESVYEDYNLKAMYSSLAQCRCRGLYEPLISACTFGTYKV